MSLVIKQRHLSGRWREMFGVHAPSMNRNRRPRCLMNDEISGEGICPDWLAQRTWEDDGGRGVGREREPAA